MGIFAKRIAATGVALWLAGGLALGFVGAASAQNIAAVTAEELEATLAEAGLNPTMMRDAATGAPVANAVVGGTSFNVRALSCSGSPIACEDLVFFANFPLGATPTTKDYRVVNGFNDKTVFGRGFILENTNEVGVDYVIELGGGVSQEHLAQNISRWADVIIAFKNSFVEGHNGS